MFFDVGSSCAHLKVGENLRAFCADGFLVVIYLARGEICFVRLCERLGWLIIKALFVMSVI